MSDWQERITKETAPAVRVEHDLRYACAIPLILSGGVWADLGCGNGLAAASALQERRPPRTVLIDADPGAAENAAAELGPNATGITGDLTDPAFLRSLGERLRSGVGPAAITCFEVIEHLSTFVPALTWMVEMATDHGATVMLSVPNDAFWSIQNPHHLSSWGTGAFRELTLLLPPEHTLLRQVAVSTSAVVGWRAGVVEQAVSARIDTDTAVCSHFLAVFGPGHELVQGGALALQANAEEQRRWERERDSQYWQMLATIDEHREALAEQDRTIARQAEELHRQTGEFDEWRAYIHELEKELGRPLSGTRASEETGDPPAGGDDA